MAIDVIVTFNENMKQIHNPIYLLQRDTFAGETVAIY